MFTKTEKARCVLLFNESKSITHTQRRFRNIFEKNPPTRNSIMSWVSQFTETGTLERKKRHIQNAQDILLNDILQIREILERNNNKISIRKIAQPLHMSKSKVHKLLKIIKFKAYKIQTFQKIENHAIEKRLFMCETLLDLLRNQPNVNLIMSDEATFHLNGRVNKHNCRIWGDENPRAFNEFERDSPKVNVWCGVSKTKIYGPFFFQEQTVNGNNYTDMLELFFYPQLQQEGILNDVYFQQDGAPPHYSLIARNSLNITFGDKWIGRAGPIEWAPYSPELTVPDFFVWGYIKERCYDPTPTNLAELRNNIINVFNVITPEMLQNAFTHFLLRLHTCIEQNGGHIQQLLY